MIFVERQDFRVMSITAFTNSNTRSQGHPMHVPSFCGVVYLKISWILLLCYRVLRGQVWSGSDAKCNFAPINANVIDTVHNMLLSNLNMTLRCNFSLHLNPLILCYKVFFKLQYQTTPFNLLKIIIKWCTNHYILLSFKLQNT